MDFPNSYFEDEVRDGFYIPAKMKRYWAAQLEFLSQIDELCERHGIQYFAHYGTLLGAIRHGGFIPWDDDLDICMKRVDLEKFIPIAREELPAGSVVLNYDEEDYSNLLVRVVNSRGINFNEAFMKLYHGCPYVIGIDIFVIDNMAPNDNLDKQQCDYIREVFSLASQVDAVIEQNKEKCYAYAENRYSEIIDKYHFVIDSRYPLKKRLHLLGEKFMTMYSDTDSDKVADFGNRIHTGRHDYPKRFFDKAIRIPFETSTICVSPYYNDILRGNYGTYMKSVRGAAGHDYPVYSIADNVLLEAIGEKWQEPVFIQESVCECREYDDSEQGRLYAVTSQMVTILDKLNNIIPALISDNNINSLVETLQQAQTVAQKLGETVEKAIHIKCNEIVTELEHYCDNVYYLYSYLTGENDELDFDCWSRENNRCINSVHKYIEEYRDKKRILILYGNKDNIPNSIANKYSDKLRYEVLYEKVAHLYNNDEETDSEVAGFMVDIIYTDEPFGEENQGYRINKSYYANRLRECCNYLVILPRDGMDEIKSDKDSLYITSRYLINNIGSMYSDAILVLSDNMRKYYIEILTSFSGEEYRSLWEKKVCLYNLKEHISEVEDRENLQKECFGELKKLCFYISAATLVTYSEESISKLEKILQIFDDNSKKIGILWVWDSTSERNLSDLEKEQSVNLSRVMEELEDIENIHKIEYEDLQSIVDECVAYYGDASSLMNKFIQAKKPVMQMDLFC